MYIVVNLLSHYLSVGIINTAIEIIAGVVVYLVMLLLLKYQFLIDVIKQVLDGLKKSKTKISQS